MPKKQKNTENKQSKAENKLLLISAASITNLVVLLASLLSIGAALHSLLFEYYERFYTASSFGEPAISFIFALKVLMFLVVLIASVISAFIFKKLFKFTHYVQFAFIPNFVAFLLYLIYELVLVPTRIGWSYYELAIILTVFASVYLVAEQSGEIAGRISTNKKKSKKSK